MKKLITILAVCLTLFAGCSGSVKDIAVTSFNIISVTPRGFNEIYATVELGIHNPIVQFTAQDIQGTIKMDGAPCIRLEADQLIVDGNSDKKYLIPVKGKLAEDFNPWQFAELLTDKDFSKMTVDASAKISLRTGIGKNFVVKDLSLEKLLSSEK